MQQGGARQPALVVVAHAEMLRERDGKAGDEQAVAIGVGVMAADRGQPFAQRGVLDGLENLVFGRHDVAELQRNARGKFLEHLDHHRMRGLDAPVQGLAAIGGIVAMAIRKRRADALQNGLRIERPRDGIGGAERPGLHRAVMKRIGEHEQPRHRAVRLRAQLVADHLDAFRRPQIDIDHDARELAGRCRGYPTSRRYRPRPPSAGCRPVHCSDRSGPTPAATGVWAKAVMAGAVMDPRCGGELRQG